MSNYTTLFGRICVFLIPIYGMEIKDIISAQQKHEKSLFQKANVVSVGCGYRFKNGKQTSEIGLIVGVSKKIPVAALSTKDVLPATLDGVPVDVYETGLIKSHQEVDPTKKHRPAIPGTSIGHKCYDKETRVLTSKGLKHFFEISPDDEIATLNNNEELEWQNPTNQFEYDYDGDMYLIDQRTVNLCITPNHKVYFRNRNKKSNFELKEIKKVLSENPYQTVQFKRNCSWHCIDFETKILDPVGYNVDQYNKFKKYSGEIASYSRKHKVPYKTLWRWKKGSHKPAAYSTVLNFSSVDWANFLGWYLAEGSTNGNTIVISEKSRVHHNEILDLFSKIGIKSHVTESGDIRASHKSLAQYLKRFGKAHEKFIPREIKDLPPAKLSVILKSLMNGDGHIENGRYRHYKTVSRQLAFDVLEIGLKCGYGVTISQEDPKTGGIIDGRTIQGKHISYRIGFSHVKLTPRLTRKPKLVKYEGKVYCLEVPNHVIFVERKGKTCWCGNSITAGTFGCVVQKGGSKLILSNNHVLSNSNNALIGDDIYQPGPIDGGSAADKIGTLFDFVPIVFDGSETPTPTCPIAKATAGAANIVSKIFGRKHRLVAFNADPWATTNKVDCAVALPLNEEDIIEDIPQIGKPVGISEADLGLAIHKFGRTTSYTTGTILQINVTVKVSYGTGKIATFVGQLMAGGMSAGGDSGSACLNVQNELVGLLYAGSETSTIFNRIQDVFEALSVTL